MASHPGTRGYSAPEYQFGERGTPSSDRYSLGVIVYEMLTGELPYGDGFQSKGDVAKLTYRSADDAPAWIDQALAKAVHKDPSRRYDSLSAFLEDLSRPNPKFTAAESRPLLERNPVGFWRGAALLLLAINAVLVYWLLS